MAFRSKTAFARAVGDEGAREAMCPNLAPKSMPKLVHEPAGVQPSDLGAFLGQLTGVRRPVSWSGQHLALSQIRHRSIANLIWTQTNQPFRL